VKFPRNNSASYISRIGSHSEVLAFGVRRSAAQAGCSAFEETEQGIFLSFGKPPGTEFPKNSEDDDWSMVSIPAKSLFDRTRLFSRNRSS
jgi:hypothetical protein